MQRFLIGFTACALASIGMLQSAMAEQAGRMDHQPTTQAESQAQSKHFTKEDKFFQSSELSDLHVLNDNNEKLGRLDNLIIDAETGQVLYGVVSTGFIRGKTIAVPWSAFRFAKHERDRVLLLGMSKAAFSNAPTFDRGELRDLMASEQWTKTMNDFFGVRTAARPVQPEQK